VAHIRTDISEERIATTIIRVKRNVELAFTIEVIHSSETSVHTNTTLHHIPEDGILRSHRLENLQLYNMCYQ
jgi:hypothetical protein